VRLLRARDRVAAPWKNGGGVTYEIAAWPPGAGFDTFEWRISMALVQSSGPFSRFEGIDRVLAVLDGGPMWLQLEGQATVELTPASPPLAFPGDRPVHAELVGAALSDLNLMVRRGVRRGTLERIAVDGPLRMGGDAETIVFALDDVGLDDETLAPLEAAWLQPGETALLSPNMASRVLLASIHDV
jgi:environmental stress-induced protein Ves